MAVLVQDENNMSVILDSEVEIAVGPAGAADNSLKFIPATHDQAQNKLLAAATVELPKPGPWVLHVSVHQGNNQGSLACLLQVASSDTRLR